MKSTLKLLTSGSKANYPIKITPPVLKTTEYVDFIAVSKEVTTFFNCGITKVVLPIRTTEVNTNITFTNYDGNIQIYSDPRAIRYCMPEYDSLHEFLNKGFTEAFCETNIEYIKVNELLGNLADNE